MGELTIIEPSVPSFSYHDIERIAAAFAQSRMFGVSDPAAALSLCLLAQAEGQHPAIAFRDYSIIQGKPAKKAEAMQRDFLMSGGKIKWLELSDTCAKAEFSHPSGGTLVIDWTMDRAKAAGIGGKDMWKKYPRQMLRSRTISEGVRSVCPMATSGMYVPEEVADFDDKTEIHIETGEALDTSGPAPRTKLDGLHKSKTALKRAIHEIATKAIKATNTDEIDTAVRDGKETIAQADKDWPELLTGDPSLDGDDEGLKRLVARRRAELTESLTFQLLMSNLEQCDTPAALKAFMAAHGDAADELDGEESRRFQTRYDEREAGLGAAAVVAA